METLTLTAPWTRLQKVLFRFSFCYILLFIFLDGMLGMIFHMLPFSGAWDSFIYWIGDAVLNLGYEMPEKPNGSGDTTYNYVQLLAILFVATVATLIWGWADRERTDYEKLAAGLRLFVAVYVGLIMVMYGMAKVLKTQFPYPPDARLAQTYGESSPMGLLWTFMGYSYPYNLFTGLGEVVGGVLLMFRRTALLGALIVIGVMSNVVVLNFSYDVPVKIYSTHLLFFAAFIAAPHVSRLYTFFILNETAEAADLKAFNINTNLGIALTMFKGLGFFAVLAMNIAGAIGLHTRMAEAEKTTDMALVGSYETVDFQSTRSASNNSGSYLRWVSLEVKNHGSAEITTVDGSTERVSFNPDTTSATIEVYTYADSLTNITLNYQHLDDSTLFISGLYKQDSIVVTLKSLPPKKYLLNERGFHWINERPFNR